MKTSPARFFALRLEPGDDLRIRLFDFAREHRVKAAFVATCVGSVTRATLRFAGREEGTVVKGRFEIVSLVGTLENGGGHLHISLSDGNGRTFGGHLMEGSSVYTTAEIVIGMLEGVRFERKVDPHTGYRELVVTPENG